MEPPESRSVAVYTTDGPLSPGHPLAADNRGLEVGMESEPTGIYSLRIT